MNKDLLRVRGDDRALAELLAMVINKDWELPEEDQDMLDRISMYLGRIVAGGLIDGVALHADTSQEMRNRARAMVGDELTFSMIQATCTQAAEFGYLLGAYFSGQES